MRSRAHATAAALTMLTLTAGCSASPTETTPSPTSPPTNSTPATRTPRITDDSGRPPVAFDPCIDLSNQQITELGYRPDTRRKTDYPAGSYTFLSCSFKSTDYLISISAGNITFAEDQRKVQNDGSTIAPTTIDDRQAMLMPTGGQCSLSMQTAFGSVILTRTAAALGTKMSAPPCEGIEDTARLISQFMPAGS